MKRRRLGFFGEKAKKKKKKKIQNHDLSLALLFNPPSKRPSLLANRTAGAMCAQCKKESTFREKKEKNYSQGAGFPLAKASSQFFPSYLSTSTRSTVAGSSAGTSTLTPSGLLLGR